MSGLYVYALVPSGLDAASLGPGLLDEALRIVALGPIAAVVGEVEDTPSIAPASLRRHDDVVRRIASASDAILPLRFGATVTGASELADGLAPRLDALSVSLERTRGCDQMTLRLDGETPSARELAQVREALAPWVRAEAIEEHRDSPLRANVFHLVERARIPAYRARVETVAAAIVPARLTATGPWPPYAFTELE
jgi:hypothetical protein